MYTDLPEFTRCCFCAPLRIGLITWGYIKLVISILIWLILVDGMVHIISRSYPVPVAFVLTVLMNIIDEIFTIILLIAAHKKHEKLFKVYYVYTIVFLVMLVLYCGLHFVYMLMAAFAYPHPYLINILIMIFISSIAIIMVQGYITLLVRSEMVKLRDRSNIQFTNHAAEAANSAAFVGTVSLHPSP